MVPAAGQGVIAVQGQRGADYGFLDVLRDPVTEEEARIERGIIRSLGAGCSFPAASYARINGNEIYLIAMYATDSGGPFVVEEISGERLKGPWLAEDLVRRLLRKEAVQ
jgi:hydroxymethylbilane synthase